MFNLQTTNPFVCLAFAEIQKEISSSIGRVDKIKPYYDLIEYQNDVIVFEYVSELFGGKKKLWSFCRKNNDRITSFDEMYSFLDLHLINIGFSHDSTLLRKFFIKCTLPKCFIKCDENFLRKIIGERIKIIKINCKIRQVPRLSLFTS